MLDHAIEVLGPVSQRDFERIRRLHIDYYERVREIVAESNGADLSTMRATIGNHVVQMIARVRV